MKTLHRFVSVWFFVLLFSLFSAARPTSLELQDAKTEEVERETDFTPLDPDLSEEELAAMGAEAFALVKESYKTEHESVTFRFGTEEEIAEILMEDNLDVLVRTLPEGTEQEEIEATARQISEGLAPAILAKFNFNENEVLVNLDVFFMMQDEYSLEGFASYEVLKAILVHETVHAIDDVEFSLSKIEDLVIDADSSQTINALLEGHAQFRSRRVCAAHDMTPAFELFSSAIGLVPETDDPVEAMVMSVYAAQMKFWYEEGERFFLAVHAAKGEDGVREVFQAPPTESVLISQPDWYLDPASRPAAEFDLEERLGVILELGEQSDRKMTKMKLLKPQVAAAFALLPEVEVESVLAELQDSLMAFYQGRDDIFSVGLFSMSSAVWSRSFYDLEEELQYVKDEALKEGSVKIVSSEYVPIEEGAQFGEAVVGNFEGLYCKKMMETGPMEMEISNLIAVRGRTVIEISAMEDGEAASIEQLVFTANLLLDPDMASDMLEEIKTRGLRESAGLGSFISLPDSASAKRDDRSSYYFRPAINIRQDGSIWTNFAQFSGDGVPKHVMTPEDGQFEDDWLFDPQAPDEYKMIREWLSDFTSVMSKMTQDGSPTEQDDREGIPVDPLLINADALSPFRFTETVMYNCRYKGIEIWRVQLGLFKGKKLNLFSSCDRSDSLRAFDGFIRGYVGDGMPSHLLAEDWMPGDDEERVVVRLSVVQEGSRLSESGERSFDPKLDDRFIYDDTRELNYQVGEKEYDAARRVRSRLKSLLRKSEDLYVVIQSGPKVTTQEVIEVYEALLDAEVTEIYFAASEEE